MKQMIINNKFWLLAVLLGSFLAVGFTSCKDDDDASNNAQMKINAVYLENAQANVTDRLVEFVRLGQMIRLEGSGFTGVKKIYFNGYSTYFNPVLVTDKNIFIQVSSKTPMKDLADNVRNTIILEKNENNRLVCSFDIRSAAPSITKLSHTMPLAGELITFEGTNLQGISKVVFPGNVEVTGGITSDEDGKYFTVAMPRGVSGEGGFVYIEGANGGGYSPTSFNFKKGVILDFDENGTQGYWSWSETGPMINNEDLESATIGEGHVSQGNYCAHRPERIASFSAAKNRCTEVWTAGTGTDDWRGQLTPYIPATTPVGKVAFQFDVYVPEVWNNTGFLGIYLINSYNGGEWGKGSDEFPNYVYNYLPWIVDKKATPFRTTGWITVTVLFSDFYYFSDKTKNYTFENVLAAREKANYANFGLFFNNSDVKLNNITGDSADEETEFASSETSIKIYTDNWRIVSLNAPEYSDFPNAE